jgi:hypothetical protein
VEQKLGKRLHSVHVRLRPEQVRFIKELARELNTDMSNVIRDLIDIAVIVLNVADRITLKDLLMDVDYDRYLRKRGSGNSCSDNSDAQGQNG